MATWASLTICEKADVARRYPSLSDALDNFWVEDDDDDDGIGTHALAKKWIEDNLKTRYESLQYQREQTEGDDYYLFDHISNPTIMLECAIENVIARLLDNMSLSYEDVHSKTANDHWHKAEKQLTRVIEQLRFDDVDGVHDTIQGEYTLVR